ncbi:MAG: hypothetical protein J6W03_05645 [Bacteroidaceae bacterium]|nr:hypothetical protein [Bacteroidaceae bacterium]
MKKVLLILSALLVSLTGKAQVSDYQNWMSGLDDNAFICQLSIPGAHDACSSSFASGSAIIAAFAGKVQTKSVQQMLPLGVRLFDLRPAVKGSNLTIYHGSLQTSFDFNTIMGQLRDYVIAHPTEFCVVMIRHETDGDSNNANFGSLLQTSLASFKDYLVDFRPNLTVGEARGKILFLSRDDYNAPIYGGRIIDWRDNQSDINNMLGGHCYGPETYKCSIWVQDNYEYSDVNVKKQAISDMLTRSKALAKTYSYTWVINETSGYKGTGTNSACQTNAKATNPYLQQLLASGNYNGPAGLVFMDYCCDGDGSGYYGLSLTKELINHNFRYTMSKQGDPIYDASGNLYVAPRGREMMWDAKFIRYEGPYKPGDYEDASAVSQLDAITGPANWYTEDFDDSAWETKHFPTASANTGAPYYSQWDGIYNVLFIRREFYVDHDPTIDTYKLYYYHDDDFKVYLNGTLLTSANGWNSDFNNYSTYTIPSSRLKVGRNVLAIMQQQNWGGAYFDCGVLRTEGTKHTLSLTADWQTYVAPGHKFNFGTTTVKAYKVVEVNGTSATLEEVTTVPADEAVVVRPDNGAGSYSIPVTQTASDLTGNLLKAATTPFTVTEANTIYCLANKSKGTGFYPVAVGVTVPKGKGYLEINGSNGNGVKPAVILFDDDDPTGIDEELRSFSSMKSMKNEESSIYNLAGQRLSKMQKGINIIGGKKVLR